MKIAIIGSGISGLGAAYLLKDKHEVVVYEKSAIIGGHARTVSVRQGDTETAVDIAVNVFSDRDYPNVMKFFKQLGVPLQRARMSFGFTGMLKNGRFEWAAHSPLGQLGNMLRPRFWRMCYDALRFYPAIGNRKITETTTLEELFKEMGMSHAFRDYWLLPMMSAIWSAPGSVLLPLPAKFFIDFFKQHGLFDVLNLPTWYNIPGGCQKYLDLLSEKLSKELRPDSAVVSVKRSANGVSVSTATTTENYDAVVFACHPDEILAMLGDTEGRERELLGAFRYYENECYVHTDASVMPKNRACWSSWIYQLDETKNAPVSSISYWVNNLQGRSRSAPVFVSLNPLHTPRHDAILHKETFSHPVYDFAAIKAQSELREIQGTKNTWYCGAWCGYGFHEDGLVSGIEVAHSIDPTVSL